jgi:putative glutamine amidotransferase
MNHRLPLIGLTGRRKTGAQFKNGMEVLDHLEGDWFYADYARGILEAGGLPVYLPLDADPNVFAQHLDGILLTGGADVAPATYGALPETDEFPPEPQRDGFEQDLLTGAIQARIPVLGICRGLQIINVHAGGTLHQHIPEHGVFDKHPGTISHNIEITKDSVLESIYGSSLPVNSLHHQTVDKVGAGLAVTARGIDNTVEALEHRELPIVAVQWHPEMLATRSSDPIFGWMVDAATRVTQSR